MNANLTKRGNREKPARAHGTNGDTKTKGRTEQPEMPAEMPALPPTTGKRGRGAGKVAKAPVVDTGRVEIANLPRIPIRRVTVPIRGLTPLVVRGWSEKARKMMLDAQMGKARVKKEPKNPEQEFLASKYVDPKSKRDSVRACFFKAAMVGAGRFVDGVNMTELRMSIFVCGDYLPLEFDECIMHEGMVRNATGVADIRFRPMYMGWRTEVTIEYRPNELTLEQVLHILREAGLRVGLCEGRPEKSRTLDWGRFDIDFDRLPRSGLVATDVSSVPKALGH